MKRLTTDNPKDNFSTMLNFVYGKDGWAHIRCDGEEDEVLLSKWAAEQCVSRDGCKDMFHTEVITMGDKCTVVRAVLCNGFEIVESSACVSAENYDEKLGAEICMGKIRDKVWMLLGFLLQTAVGGVKGSD